MIVRKLKPSTHYKHAAAVVKCRSSRDVFLLVAESNDLTAVAALFCLLFG